MFIDRIGELCTPESKHIVSVVHMSSHSMFKHIHLQTDSGQGILLAIAHLQLWVMTHQAEILIHSACKLLYSEE